MSDERFSLGGIRFDVVSGEISCGEQRARLSPQSAGILSQLARFQGQVVTRPELLDSGWGEANGSDESLTRCVSEIRRAFRNVGAENVTIETLAKRGYRLSVNGNQQNEVLREPKSSKSYTIYLAIGLLTLLIAIMFSHPLRHAIVHLFHS